MKVKIQTRQVYHKFAEVEVEVPNNIDEFDVQEYLNDNENLWVDKIDQQMSEADYNYGFGTDSDANSYNNSFFNETKSESEWRYDCPQLKIGGHL